MTAALYLVPPAAAAAQVGDAVVLDGPEGRHAVAVARTAMGERIALADGGGVVLDAVVVEVRGRDHLVARVERRVVTPAPDPRVVVVQGLPKGERGETAVETMTEVGVDVVVPWQAQRCIVRWTAERAERGRARWLATARAAAKQSRRAWLPEVAPLGRTDDVAARVSAASAALVLHEEALLPLHHVDLPDAGDIVLVVGPEGGIAPDELDVLMTAGATPVSVGPTVLRTSTAGTVAAALVLAATGRWDAPPGGRMAP